MKYQELARQAREAVSILTLTSFLRAILPNKLLQEFRAMARGARLDIPQVDKVATDIFMGTFSDKFLEATERAAGLLLRDRLPRAVGPARARTAA